MTQYGSCSLIVRRPTEICRSCIASSSADWVRGVARLISSASTSEDTNGPSWNCSSWPPPSVSTSTFVPWMSAGIMSGVNWIRENGTSTAWPIDLTSIVLPSPGTPSSITWPPANSAVSAASSTGSWPTMKRCTSRLILSCTSRNRWASRSATSAGSFAFITAVRLPREGSGRSCARGPASKAAGRGASGGPSERRGRRGSRRAPGRPAGPGVRCVPG